MGRVAGGRRKTAAPPGGGRHAPENIFGSSFCHHVGVSPLPCMKRWNFLDGALKSRGGPGWLMMAFVFGGLLASGGARSFGAEPVWKHFRGICDASAMEMLNDDLFLVADDEDNVLRIYSREKQGFPVGEYDFSKALGLQKKKKEIDFEGSARLGDHIFFISSHGANAKGKMQPSRHRIFALQVGKEGSEMSAVGFYSNLLRDLAAEPEFSSFEFHRAAMRPPKEKGALNIESLAATPEGHLLVGFRNPIPGGRALLVRIENPMEIIHGKRARFGKAVQLDLDGLGIRSLTAYRDGYLIVAGNYSGEGASQLYQWNGESAQAMLLQNGAGLPGNPEGIAVVKEAGRDKVFALSDDGTMKIGDKECKKLKDRSLKVFRAYEMDLGPQLTRN